MEREFEPVGQSSTCRPTQQFHQYSFYLHYNSHVSHLYTEEYLLTIKQGKSHNSFMIAYSELNRPFAHWLLIVDVITNLSPICLLAAHYVITSLPLSYWSLITSSLFS